MFRRLALGALIALAACSSKPSGAVRACDPVGTVSARQAPLDRAFAVGQAADGSRYVLTRPWWGGRAHETAWLWTVELTSDPQ
jgi:hypothetical protein